MLNFERLHKHIDENNSFLLTTHINPDGDAIGSEMALYYYLKRLGKQVEVVNCNETPDNMLFLDTAKVIREFKPENDSDIFNNFDVLIAVDFNRLDRIMIMEEGFRASNSIKVCIDHHENTEEFTEHLFVDKSYASTGEIILDFIDSQKEVKVDYEIALPLYTAIMTDTGSFKYERTYPSTHLKAARLLEAGVDPKWVFRQVFDNGTVGRLRLLGRALDSLQLHYDGQLATMVISQSDLNDTGTVIADMEGFINYNLSIKGVRIGLFFYELDNGFKVSFRSVGQIPINKLASEFEGGGHFHAAGASVKGATIKDYYNKVIEAAAKYLNNGEDDK
jgi:phosphoesterase RecJ-like protein